MFWVMMENGIKDLNNAELIRKNAEAQYGCPVAYTYTFEEIGNIVKKFGIKIEKIWKDHIFTWDIDNYKNNVYVKDEYWKNVGDELLKEYERDLGWHTLFIGKK